MVESARGEFPRVVEKLYGDAFTGSYWSLADANAIYAIVRAIRKFGGTMPPPDYEARSLELLNTLIGGRTDAQLREEMVAKFRTIGVKLG